MEVPISHRAADKRANGKGEWHRGLWGSGVLAQAMRSLTGGRRAEADGCQLGAVKSVVSEATDVSRCLKGSV